MEEKHVAQVAEDDVGEVRQDGRPRVGACHHAEVELDNGEPRLLGMVRVGDDGGVPVLGVRFCLGESYLELCSGFQGPP